MDPKELKELNLRKAVDYVRKHQNDPERQDLDDIAASYNVNRSTMTRRAFGNQKPHHEAHEKQQKLSKGQEIAVGNWAKRMSELGFPVTHDMLKKMAIKVVGEATTSQPGWILGQNWTKNFLKRNPEFKTQWTVYSDKARKDAEDPEVIKAFRLKLYKLKQRFAVKDENLWNCDEKGFNIGHIHGKTKVIVHRNYLKKIMKTATNTNREFTTTLETVSATGKVIAPYIVWQAKSRIAGSYAIEEDEPEGEDEGEDKDENSDSNAGYVYSPSGYMDNELGRIYMEKHFEPLTRPKIRTDGELEPRILLVDGHDSHVNWELVDYALEHKIHVICFPAHLTHILQPLDVGCFGILARKYKEQHADWIYEGPRKTGRAGTKPDTCDKTVFWHILRKARIATFTPDTIKAAWEAAGCWPIQFEASDLLEITKTGDPSNLESAVNMDTPAKIRTMAQNLKDKFTNLENPQLRDQFEAYELLVVSKISQYRDKTLKSGKSLEPGHLMKLSNNKSVNRKYVQKQKHTVENRVAKKKEQEKRRTDKEKAKLMEAVEEELAHRASKLSLDTMPKENVRKATLRKKKPHCTT